MISAHTGAACDTPRTFPIRGEIVEETRRVDDEKKEDAVVSQDITTGWNVQDATRLDMGQYGLVGELLHGAFDERDTADLR
jgi:hypothetical protein